MRALRLFWMLNSSSSARWAFSFAPPAPRAEQHFEAIEPLQQVRDSRCRAGTPARRRCWPVGAAGVAGDEDEFVLLAAVRAPLQVVLDLDRLVVLVDAEEADVEVVARVLEVVRVAAEEGDLLLGGEDEADVGVLLEACRGGTGRPRRA